MTDSATRALAVIQAIDFDKSNSDSPTYGYVLVSYTLYGFLPSTNISGNISVPPMNFKKMDSFIRKEMAAQFLLQSGGTIDPDDIYIPMVN
jgi:hypothetical protein